MIVLHRRHGSDCHRDRKNQKCRCPLWIDWRIAGKRIRRPLHTRDWIVAQHRVRQLEAEGTHDSAVIPLTVEQACQRFISDAKSRGLREPSIYKYDLLFRQLQLFCGDRGVSFLTNITIEDLRAFRESWPNKSLSASKKLELLKAFFRFCDESEWIKTNPAKALKPPKVALSQVVPFTDPEMKKILEACDSHPIEARGLQLRALVLLMRYSGLRISDATAVRRDAIIKGVLELRTTKTGVKVRVPLKPEVLTALKSIPQTNEFYFYSGTSKPRTRANVWQNTFLAMFKRAGIKGHSHQLRHTFAISLLLAGVSLEDVSKLMGHGSIRITEQHYSAWIPARQTRLEEAVKKTW